MLYFRKQGLKSITCQQINSYIFATDKNQSNLLEPAKSTHQRNQILL